MFRRGKPREIHSFKILLKKSSKGRYPSLEVNYDFKGKIDTVTYENSDLIIKATQITELSICLATGPDKINNAAFFVNGKSHAFANIKNRSFNWKKYGEYNYIMDKRQQFDGKISLTLFTILEDAGGVIYNLE